MANLLTFDDAARKAGNVPLTIADWAIAELGAHHAQVFSLVLIRYFGIEPCCQWLHCPNGSPFSHSTKNFGGLHGNRKKN